MSWPIVRLEQLLASGKGALKIGPFGSQLKKTDLSDTGVHVVGIENVLTGLFDGLGTRYISSEKFSELKSFEILPGDVLVTTMGTIGETRVVPDNIGTSIMDSHLLRLRVANSLCRIQYLCWVLRGSSSTKQALHGKAHGAIMKGLNSSIVRSLPVPLPPPSEQARIVEILNQADELRRKRTEVDAKSQNILAMIYHNMFGNSQTACGQWERTTLGQATRIDAPFVDPLDEKYLDLPHIGADKIQKDTGRLLPAKTVREDGLISGKFLFDERYVLYCKIRPYLRKVALPTFRGLCSADVYPVRPDPDLMTREYLWMLLLSPDFTAYSDSLSSRANMPKINREQLEAFNTVLPPLALQERFSERARQMLTIREKQEAAKRGINTLYEVLLHRAFSGGLTARWREAHMKELLREMEIQASYLKGDSE